MEEININFKLFLESQHQKDMDKTLKTIPKKHRDLVKGYNFSVEVGNTLKGDPQNVGEIDAKNKKIRIAAPWNYPKEFVLLHEIGHAVWESLDNDIKKKWNTIVSQTKNKQMEKNPKIKQSLRQNSEEIFCHCYACFYSKHKLMTYHNKIWMDFIENLPK